MSNKKEVRERFIECFDLLDLKREEVITGMPYNKGNLSSILSRGDRYMPEKKIELFCKLYGANKDYIFKGTEPKIFKKENKENKKEIANSNNTNQEKPNDMMEKFYKEQLAELRKDLRESDQTIEEVRTLAETEVKFNNQIKQAFLFSCFTGLRMGDIIALKHSEIHGDEIVLTPKKTRYTSGKMLRFPLTSQAKEILNTVPKKNEIVFWSLPKRQMIGKAIIIWGLTAKLDKHLHFHAARHTFATIGITHGIDVYTMKELLGHSKIEMTQIYAKIVDDKKKSETSKFPTL